MHICSFIFSFVLLPNTDWSLCSCLWCWWCRVGNIPATSMQRELSRIRGNMLAGMNAHQKLHHSRCWKRYAKAGY